MAEIGGKTATSRLGGSRKHGILVVVVCTVAVVAIVGGAGYVALWQLGEAFSTGTHDVSKYDAERGKWAGAGLVEHFPVAIPANAKRVRFFAAPKIMQGGAYIQLRMQLPAEEIRQIEARCREATTRAAVASGDGKREKNGPPPPEFLTGDYSNKSQPFPERFTVYVLRATDRSGGTWNHGSMCGAAVSGADGEVVYWAEYW